MLSHHDCMDIHDIFLDQLLGHPWHVNEDAITYTFDCLCAECESLHSLRYAVLAYAEAQLWKDHPARCGNCGDPHADHQSDGGCIGPDGHATGFYTPMGDGQELAELVEESLQMGYDPEDPA